MADEGEELASAASGSAQDIDNESRTLQLYSQGGLMTNRTDDDIDHFTPTHDEEEEDHEHDDEVGENQLHQADHEEIQDELEEEPDDEVNESADAKEKKRLNHQMTHSEFFRPASNATPETNEFVLLVVLQPDGVRHRVAVNSNMTLAEVKKLVCDDLKLDKELLSFPDLDLSAFNQNVVVDDLALEAIGINVSADQNAPEPTLQMHVARRATTGDYVMPDRIQVQVFDDQSQSYRTISVEIVKFAGKKPYFGGYRHCKTQRIYHHAIAQTCITRAARRSQISQAHRETQTQQLVTCSQQTQRETGTQMARNDLFQDDSGDREITSRPYFDSFQCEKLREDSVLLIQRVWRGFCGRCFVAQLRQQHHDVAVDKQQQESDFAVQDAAHQRKEIFRRMHPKTVADFEVLYNELDRWRQFETKKIRDSSHHDESHKQKALEELLAKETKLLQTIDRLKLTATEANRKQRIESMMAFLARPKNWQMSDGGVKEVHTPFTIRAKELMDLYHGLKAGSQSVTSMDERLEILLHVKWTVQEFECALTREIVELIDREADMLNRGRKEKSLEGLRKRMSNLFLQFIENPEFNPEAATLQHAKGCMSDLTPATATATATSSLAT